MTAPWIMVDELVYSELAKSVAATGHFLIRDQASGSYGFVYPLVIAPAWRLFGAVPDAYAAAKAINSVAMSLAAVPAYFLARRVLSQWLSLAAALLAVAVPSMVYTGTLMTENAFYPIFLAAALVLVLMLERPTWQRQLLVLGIALVAFATRAQAVALVPGDPHGAAPARVARPAAASASSTGPSPGSPSSRSSPRRCAAARRSRCSAPTRRRATSTTTPARWRSGRSGTWRGSTSISA